MLAALALHVAPIALDQAGAESLLVRVASVHAADVQAVDAVKDAVDKKPKDDKKDKGGGTQGDGNGGGGGVVVTGEGASY